MQSVPPSFQAEKTCSACRLRQPLSNFSKNRSRPDGLSYDCKPCQKSRTQQWAAKNQERVSDTARKGHLARAYGLTEPEYEALLAAQGGVCAICRKPETSVHWAGKVKRLHIDHDHTTGQLRGLLCTHCNRGLGGFADSRENLEAAIRYLKSHA